ncbi:L-rhamnose mutarotase [Sphingomonas sp. SAFR-052]|uniref:L-rhamnose mutarotase n=1 Tax=Sphingomonas sp. SAFR-052 TaxID=3436867 RepID=UPI003F823D55
MRPLAAYDLAHAPGNTPPEVIAAQLRYGIAELQIHRAGCRLVMLMEVTPDFDPAGLDAERHVHPAIDQWHIRMGALQRSPFADGKAWPEAKTVFRQSDHVKGTDRS